MVFSFMLFAALAFQAQARNPGGVSVVIPGTDQNPRDVSVVIPGADPESRGCQCCHSGHRLGIQGMSVLSFRAQTQNPGGVSVVIPGTDPESRGCWASLFGNSRTACFLCLPVKIDLPVYAELVGERTEIGTPKDVLYGHGDRPASGKLSEEPVRLFLTFRAHGY